MISLRHTALCLSLLVSPLGASAAFAQPDTAPRGVVPPKPPEPLSADELQKLTGGPTLITFSGKDVPLNDIIKLFRAAAGMPEEGPMPWMDNPRNQRKISVDWKDAPFWTAAKDVEALTDMRWNTSYMGTLNLINPSPRDGSGLRGRVVAQTPFALLVADTVNRSSNKMVPISAEPANNIAPPDVDIDVSQDRVGVNLSLYLDPRLTLADDKARAVNVSWKANNQTRRVDSPTGYGGGMISPLIVKVAFNLTPVPSSGTQVSSITGAVQANIAAKSDIWKADDIQAVLNVPQTVGDTQIVIRQANYNAPSLTINLEATQQFEPEQTDTPRHSLSLFSALQVADSKGAPLFPGGRSLSGGGGGNGQMKMTGQLSFNAIGPDAPALEPPFKIEWRISTQVRPLEIPFELRGIIVP